MALKGDWVGRKIAQEPVGARISVSEKHCEALLIDKLLMI